MTRDQYQELVEFLGRQFDAVKDRLTRVEVGVEENRHGIQLVAEAVTTVDDKLERFREETATEFRAVRSEMAEGLAAVRGEMAEGLAAVRGEMAEGLAAVRSEMAEGLAAVRSEMAEGFTAVRSEMAEGFNAHGKRIEALQLRMSRWDGYPA